MKRAMGRSNRRSPGNPRRRRFVFESVGDATRTCPDRTSTKLIWWPQRDSNPCSRAAARFCQRSEDLRRVESTSFGAGRKSDGNGSRTIPFAEAERVACRHGLDLLPDFAFKPEMGCFTTRSSTARRPTTAATAASCC